MGPYDYDDYDDNYYETHHLRDGISRGPDGEYYDDDGEWVPEDCIYDE